jgi:hypothetical protein
LTGVFLLILFVSLKGSYNNSKAVEDLLTATPVPSSPPTVMTDVSQEELQQYYDTYKKPYVIQVRTSLDAYLANESSKTCILQAAVDRKSQMGIVTGLDSFSKDYYRSKFVVVTVDDSKIFDNAKDIQIMFQDKPDRIFYALVGIDPSIPNSNEYCLLGFNSKEDTDQEAVQQLNEFYKPLLFDKEHAL